MKKISKKSFGIAVHPIAHGLTMLHNLAAKFAKKAKGELVVQGKIKSKLLQRLNEQREALAQELENGLPESKYILAPAIDAAKLEKFFASQGKLGGNKVKIVDGNMPDLAYGNYLVIDLAWKKKGQAKDIVGYGDLYKGFRLDVSQSAGVLVYDADLVRITTKSGDTVLIQMHDGVSLEELPRLAMDMHRDAMKASEARYDGVRIPKSEMEYFNNFTSWFGSLAYVVNGVIFRYTDCSQRSKLVMDEVGVRVKVETTMKITKSIGPRDLIINKPFVLAIFRKGLSLPIYAAYLSYDSWHKSS
jgi:hypothetical protein